MPLNLYQADSKHYNIKYYSRGLFLLFEGNFGEFQRNIQSELLSNTYGLIGWSILCIISCTVLLGVAAFIASTVPSTRYQDIYYNVYHT